MFNRPFAPDQINEDIEKSLNGKSTKEIMEIAEHYLRVAMHLLQNPKYHALLGGYDEMASQIHQVGDPYYAKNFTPEYMAQITGSNYMSLARAHQEAKAYILENLRDKLNPNDLQALEQPANRIK